MNKIIVAALALAMYIPIGASATEFKITAYEAGLDGGTKVSAPGSGSGGVTGDGGTVIAPATKIGRWTRAAAVEPKAPKFVIVATATVEGAPVWQGMYRHEPFDSKDACEAFVKDDAALKESNDGLAVIVTQRIHPDAKVGVSCEELPAEE